MLDDQNKVTDETEHEEVSSLEEASAGGESSASADTQVATEESEDNVTSPEVVESEIAATSEETLGDAADSESAGITEASEVAGEEVDEALDVEDEDEDVPDIAPIMEIDPDAEEAVELDWYILKVQSNRERSISEALQRKVAIEGLDRFFDQIIVPTEKVTEFKNGKKKIVERKLWPGYIVVHMHINDDTWFAVRETSGIGDFTGAAGKPTPMLAHEVARIIQTEEEDTEDAPKLAIKFKVGDKVKVKEGNFESFEGEVNTIDEASGRVTVMINIFGRSTPVELEYWQIESI